MQDSNYFAQRKLCFLRVSPPSLQMRRDFWKEFADFWHHFSQPSEFAEIPEHLSLKPHPPVNLSILVILLHSLPLCPHCVRFRSHLAPSWPFHLTQWLSLLEYYGPVSTDSLTLYLP